MSIWYWVSVLVVFEVKEDPANTRIRTLLFHHTQCQSNTLNDYLQSPGRKCLLKESV